MKNRNIFIAVFLCLSLLVVGVGYATLSGHLSISGSAYFDKEAAQEGFIENIIFDEKVNITSTGAAAVADEATASGQTATFTVRSLAAQNETVTFEYTLTNENTVDALITIKAQHDDTPPTPNPTTNFDYYQVRSITVGGNAMVVDDAAQTEVSFQLGNKDSGNNVTTVVVVVELVKTPAAIVSESFAMHLVATSVDAVVSGS